MKDSMLADLIVVVAAGVSIVPSARADLTLQCNAAVNLDSQQQTVVYPSAGMVGPLLLENDVATKGSGLATGDTTAGHLTAAAHACAAPIPPASGQVAGGSGGSSVYQLPYTVQSASLPAGTPVTLVFTIAAAHTSGTNATDSALASASATVTLTDGAITYLTASGFYQFNQLTSNPPTLIQSGLLAPGQLTTALVFPTSVGATIYFSATLGVGASCDVTPDHMADISVEAAVMWGYHSETADVTLISGTPPPQEFQSDANVSHANVQLLVPPPISPLTCLGDINVDGVVNGADLGILLGHWGGFGIGDLNGDGVVDGADLGILLGHWGPCSL